MSTLFRLLSSTEDEVRASTLSVLSSVCSVLRVGMRPYVVDLTNALMSAISIDRVVEVRRGAMLLLAHVLTSLGADAPAVLSTALRPLPE